MKDFFRKVYTWIVEHKKTVIAVCITALVVVVITACSTFGDVGEVQFGLKNDINKEVSA